MSVPLVVRDLIVAQTRVLKLTGVTRTFEGLARQARDARWSQRRLSAGGPQCRADLAASVRDPPAAAGGALPGGEDTRHL
jgi:hypothetical protein